MKRSAITRGKPLARGKPLKSGKPMKRGKPLRAKGGSRFPKRRDPQYAVWIRAQRCLLQGRWYPLGTPTAERGTLISHRCWSPIQVCHVRSRGAGGDDHGNIVPMCAGAHDEQHRIGIKSFQARWGIDLKAEAARLYQTYLRETGFE